MKNKKETAHPNPRVHISREDRARTKAGKTINSKVRSEGRTLAARQRSALASQGLKASETKEKISR